MILSMKILYIYLTYLIILEMIWTSLAHILYSQLILLIQFSACFCSISFNYFDHSLTWDTLISQQTAKGIAEGDLDPFTKMPFQVILSLSLSCAVAFGFLYDELGKLFSLVLLMTVLLLIQKKKL